MSCRLVLLLCLAWVLLIGCQRSGHDRNSLPTSPSLQASTPGFGEGGHQLLGLWEMNADAGAGTLEAAPMRGGAFHMNVRQWVEEPVMNLEILYARALPNNGLETRIQIKHPFTNPIMWGFDVRGICILPGSMEYPKFGAWVSDESKGDPVLADAEGYTRLWNPAQFGGSGIFAWTPGKLGKTPPVIGIATVNGFRNFMTDRHRHAFEPGETVSAYYYLRIPGGAVKFTYAIDASWSPPTKNPPSGPDDFPISANMPEAYRVAAALTPEFSENGTGILTVDLADWQGPESVSTVKYELPPELGGASGEMPLTHVLNLEGRFRTTISGNTSSGGERVLIEVTDWCPIPIPEHARHMPSLKCCRIPGFQRPSSMERTTSKPSARWSRSMLPVFRVRTVIQTWC